MKKTFILFVLASLILIISPVYALIFVPKSYGSGITPAIPIKDNLYMSEEDIDYNFFWTDYLKSKNFLVCLWEEVIGIKDKNEKYNEMKGLSELENFEEEPDVEPQDISYTRTFVFFDMTKKEMILRRMDFIDGDLSYLGSITFFENQAVVKFLKDKNSAVLAGKISKILEEYQNKRKYRLLVERQKKLLEESYHPKDLSDCPI
jgi:hypothetical protein